MQPVPVPNVLNDDRVLDDDRDDMRADHQARADACKKGYIEAAEYAKQLWNALAAARTYLWESLPSDPRDPGARPRTSTAPTGPDDEAGWNAWIDAYAGVTSVLCGPHGDSGFGAGEARETARFRRDAPNVQIAARAAAARPETSAEPSSAAESAPAARPTSAAPARVDLRTAALLAAGVALGRWLVPRHTVIHP